MVLPRPFAKFIAIFRGDVSPVFILLSTALGFWFGLMPGWYGLHVALLVVVLILNVHLGLFILFAGIGKAVCFAAAPVLYYVGGWVQGALSPLLDFLAALPIVGITDYARQSVAGSVVLGPVIGFIVGAILAQSVARFRRAWLKLEDNSDTFREWYAKGWVRLLERVLIGKRVKDVREVLKRKPRVIRLAGVGLAVILLVATGAALHFVTGARVKGYAASALTTANGAPVSLDELGLSPLSGRVMATRVEAADPQNLALNRIAVGEFTADASLWNLLRGKLVLDDVSLGGVAFGQRRSAAAAKEAPAAPTAARTASPSVFDAAVYQLASVDVAKLRTYFQDARQIDKWLKQVGDWLPESKPEPPKPQPPQKYLEYLTARAVTPPTPRILVRRALLDDVDIAVAGVGKSTIQCANLSDAPRAAGVPASVTIQSKERPLEVALTYDPVSGVGVRGHVDDVDLKNLQTSLSPDNPVVFEGGTASVAISGTASREQIDLKLDVETHDMKLRSTGAGVFDLDPRVTDEAVRLLSNVKTTLRVVGPLAEPRLVFDRAALAANFREALVNAGKAELASQLDKLVGDKLPGGVPDADAVLKNPLDTAGKTLGGLLDQQLSKNKDEKKDETAKREDKKKKEDEKKSKADERKEKAKKGLEGLRDKLKGKDKEKDKP